MDNSTELAQRMKAAALKLDGEQWQTRDGFSGIEVIVKGSVAKGRGCVSYQPVAAELADSKTAKAIALFSPANIKALVEALEAAERRSAEYEGMVFVPVEPTLDQLVAGKRRLTSTGRMSRLMSQRLAEVYRAMVGVAVEGDTNANNN
ncbi:TPA: hypothetical protein L3360_001243 [Escherichia coli]|nr:hypothetical protein [Escherichia coli]